MFSKKLPSVFSVVIAVMMVLAGSLTTIPKALAAPPNYGHVMDSAPEHAEYTRAIQLADSSILAAANYFYDPYTATIRFYKSTNGGSTFSFLSEFDDTSVPAVYVIGTEDVFQLTDGSLILSYIAWNPDDYIGDGQTLKIWKSSDGGVTWNYISTLETNATWQWEPEFAYSSDGRLQIYYSFTAVKSGDVGDNIYRQVIVRRESTDGGLTWSNRFTAVGDSNHGVGMPRIVKASGNLYYMAFEHYQDATSVHVLSSTDGKNWPTCCGNTMESATGWMHSTPALTYANGALIGTGKSYRVQNSFDDHPNNGEVLLYSIDGGATWAEMIAPFTIRYTNDDHTNWSPDLLPLSNDQLFEISVTDASGRPNDIRYDTGPVTIGGGGTPPPSFTRLQNRKSSKCVDVLSASGSNGADVIQYSCHTDGNQQWTMEDVGGGYVQLRVQHSGKCADISKNNVRQWTCGSGTDQHWTLEDMGGGYFRLRNRANNLCMDVQGASTDDLASIVVSACTANTSQQFRQN